MYVGPGKIMLQRRGPIPYEKHSIFDVQFFFLRFVRRGTVDDPDMQNPSACEGFQNPPPCEVFFKNTLPVTVF